MELDPVAELTVREIISDLGLIVVGWYHSHPKFQPDPSVTDINNQQQYQNLMKDEVSGIEPFVGLIVSTYDLKLPSLESHHQWFNTRYYSDGTRGKKPFSIPMLLETSVGIFSDIYHDVDAFSSAINMDFLVKKLLELDSDSESSLKNCIQSEIPSNSNIDNKEKSIRKMNSDGKKIPLGPFEKDNAENSQNQRNVLISKKRLNHRNVEKEVVAGSNDHYQYQGDDFENDDITQPLILRIGVASEIEKRKNQKELIGTLGQKRSRNSGSESISMRNGQTNQGDTTSSMQVPNLEKLTDDMSNQNQNKNEVMKVDLENKEEVSDQGRNHVAIDAPLSTKEHSDDEGSQYIFGIKVPCSSKKIQSSTLSISDKVPISFRAAGGSGYLGEYLSIPLSTDGNLNNISNSDNNNDNNDNNNKNFNNDNNNNDNKSNDYDGNNRNDNIDKNGNNSFGKESILCEKISNSMNNGNKTTDTIGKMKYNGKTEIATSDDANVGRRSGREIKCREIYVPEKEKKLKISLPSTSSSSSTVGIGSNVKVAGIPKGKKLLISAKTSSSSHGISSRELSKSKGILVEFDEQNVVSQKKQRISASALSHDFLPSPPPLFLKAGKGKILKRNSNSETNSKSGSGTSFSSTNEKKSNRAITVNSSNSSMKKSINQSKITPVPRGSIKLSQKEAYSQSDSSLSSLAVASKDDDNRTVTIDKRRKERKLQVQKNINFTKKDKNSVQPKNKDESFFDEKNVHSQIENGNETELLKRRRKGSVSKSSIDVNSKELKDMQVEGNIANKGPKREIEELNKNISMLQKLQSSGNSSEKGRILLCSIHPNFRFLLLGIVSLGFYYAGNPRRMDLNEIWRDGIFRSEKLKGSIRVWACKLSTSLSSTEKLIDDIIDFLLSCWLDSDEEVSKMPKIGISVKRKKAAVCLHDGGNCHASHPHSHNVSLQQKFLIYKEDRGEIKVTKKRKKKKLVKEK